MKRIIAAFRFDQPLAAALAYGMVTAFLSVVGTVEISANGVGPEFAFLPTAAALTESL